MGFIPQVSTKTLYAYLTPLGRQYILDGDREDFQIAFFSLHDDDVNYYISSNISSTTAYYTLQSGFIPDITGDNDSCIKSIANGTRPNMFSTLSGSTVIDPATGKLTVGTIGINGTIGARNTVIAGPANTNIDGGVLDVGRDPQATSFPVSITPDGDTVSLIATEISNSKFYVKITNPSPNDLIGSFKINKTLVSVDEDLLITPTTTFQLVNVTYQLLATPQANQKITFTIVITPFSTSSSVVRGTLLYTTTSRGGGGVSGGGGAGIGG